MTSERRRDLIIAGVILCVFVALFGSIWLSGFLPASEGAKKAFTQAELINLNSEIEVYWHENDGRLPKSWEDIRAMYTPGSEPQMFDDPFKPDRGHFNSRFEDSRIVIWSVGPNRVDDLSITGHTFGYLDEIGLIVQIEDKELRFNRLGWRHE